MQLHTTYEKLVYALTHFLQSGQLISLVLDFVNRLTEDLEIVGGFKSGIKRFIKVLNRAALRTFNSPCIMRHLFHSSFQLGDYEEAQHALHTYLYLVGFETKALIDMKSTTNAIASEAFGYLTPVPNTDEKEELALEKGAYAKHEPSWHLLALLCSCPVKDDLTQSLKIIEIALAEASPASAYKQDWVDYTDEIVQYLLLHMTQILFIDHINGPEAAMSSQEALFSNF